MDPQTMNSELTVSARGEQRPWMSVIVATYNSAKRLPNLVENLRGQQRPANGAPLEIMAVDGGSSDETLLVAQQLGMRVLENPHGDPVHAKSLGLGAISSQYACFLDHDELLESSDSLLRKYELMRERPEVKIAVPSGYRIDKSMSSCNAYASEFGDPFSCFFYRTPNDANRRVTSYVKRLPVDEERQGAYILQPAHCRVPILCEAAACASVVDADYFRHNYPQVLEDPMLIGHLYSLMSANDSSSRLAIFQDDAVLHDSAESWSLVFRKVRWRLINAMSDSDLSQSGFSGRHQAGTTDSIGTAERRDSQISRRTKLFGAYTLAIVPVFLDSARLSAHRRRPGYMMNAILALALPYWAGRYRISRKARNSMSNLRYGH